MLKSKLWRSLKTTLVRPKCRSATPSISAWKVTYVLGVERTRRLFPLLLVVLPAKLLVAGRIVTWSEIAGAVLACICRYFLSGYPKRTAVVAGLIVSLLIVRGLAPYHWSRIANPFSWVPFGGFLRARWDFGLLTLLQKSFWYGSALLVWAKL